MKILPSKCDQCEGEAVIVCSLAGSEKEAALCRECFEKELVYDAEDYTEFLPPREEVS